ncbi:MAG: hypothetical protein WBZ40_13335 [Acidimicrobiia bacterium]
MTSTRRVFLWVWVGVVGAACCGVLSIAVQQPGSPVRATSIALGSWFPAVVTLLGALIAVRQPDNRIARLLIGIGFAVLLEYFAQLALGSEPVSPSLLDFAAIVLVHVTLPLAMYLLFLIAFLFPTGRFSTKRQAWAAWPGAIMLFIQLLITVFTVEIGPPYPSAEQAWTIENPVGFLPTSARDATIALALVILALTAVAGGFSLVMRYRRSSVVIRAQIRWMLFSTFIVAGVLVLVATTNASQHMAGGLLLQVAFISIPISITVAISRYRLFEIDRIISRTLSYTVVVAVLAAAFFGLIALITAALPTQSSLAVAGSTLAIAALFNPLRKRVQSTIDRRFNRSAYHAEVIARTFANRLREPLSTTQIIKEWQRTVDESLQPETSGIWIKQGSLDGPE